MLDKDWKEFAGIDMTLDDCIETLKREFHLSPSKIAYKLVEKAIEIKPEKKKFVKVTSKMVNQAIKDFIEKEKLSCFGVGARGKE